MTTSTIPDSLGKAIIRTANSIVRHIVYTKYRPGYFRDEEIEDISSEAIADATRSIAGFKTGKSLENWMWSIAANCIKDAVREKKLDEDISVTMPYFKNEEGEEFSPADFTQGSRDFDTEARAVYGDLNDRADEIAGRVLGERDLRIYYYMKEEYTPREIAKELGCTANAVSIRKNHIMAMLKEAEKEFTAFGKKKVS